jgi:hypothetical protein
MAMASEQHGGRPAPATMLGKRGAFTHGIMVTCLYKSVIGVFTRLEHNPGKVLKLVSNICGFQDRRHQDVRSRCKSRYPQWYRSELTWGVRIRCLSYSHSLPTLSSVNIPGWSSHLESRSARCPTPLLAPPLQVGEGSALIRSPYLIHSFRISKRPL